MDTSVTVVVRTVVVIGTVLANACGGETIDTAGSTFSFAVLGDAPYRWPQEAQFRRAIRQMNDADLRLVIDVGDILWYPCSDALYRNRLALFQSVRHPLVYTPGDNEWTDCHEQLPGSYDPLDRLERLRSIFFETPTQSLGGRPIALTVQASDSTWGEFVENARWSIARIVFATVHLVGSRNGLNAFAGRTDQNDVEVARRTAAATAWLRSTFAHADSVDALGVVIAMHADPVFTAPVDDPYRQAYEPFLAALEEAGERFEGPVLVVHGDSHEYIVDRPLVRRTTGRVLDNVTRLEVFGSPVVGWVQVAVDTTASSQRFRFVPHRVPKWLVW